MSRFVALGCLLAGCALGSEPRLGNDGGEVDSVADSGDPADAAPDAPPDACIAVAELCNNADDDCDGDKDEELGLGMPCDGADTDACNEGMIVCDGNGATTCADTTADSIELCNGMDDDCKNGPDDTFPVGQSCTVGLGACATMGQYVCNGAMTGTTCNAVAGAATREVCGNDIDEDCNGVDPACPANDAAAGAIDITAGGTFTADLTTARDDNWEASTTFDCGDQGGRDVFYQFTLPAEEVVYFDTFGTSFDSVVRVFAGACTSLGAAQTCADDACSTTRSQGAVNLAAGTYCLVVDQFSFNTTAGASVLNFKRGGRSGIGIATASSTQTGTTTGKPNQSIAGCEANTMQGDVGYFFLTCPERTYTISASTCTGTAFDTILYLRAGAATGGDVACSDDATGCGTSGFQSRFTGATLLGPNVNWLIVDGFGQTGNGNYTLTYTMQ